MATLNVSLSEEMKDFIEAQARKEGYGTASEYLLALVDEAQKREAKRSLETKLREGLESGPAPDLTSEEWDAPSSVKRSTWPPVDAGHEPDPPTSPGAATRGDRNTGVTPVAPAVL